jgi:oligosaccharide repeat unit polymerase
MTIIRIANQSLQRSTSKHVIVFLVLGLFVVSTLALIIQGWESTFFFFAIGTVCLLLTLLFVLTEPIFDPYSLWSLGIVFNVIMGITLRSIYIVFGIPNQQTIEHLFLLGQPIDVFIQPSLIILLSLALLGLGYTLGSNRYSKPIVHRKIKVTWQPSRLYWAVIICSVLSIGVLIIFIEQTGGLNLQQLSSKRSAISYTYELDLSEYHGYGYLRALNNLSTIAYLLMLTHCAITSPILTKRQILILGALFINAVLLPIYSSQRAPIMWLIISSFAIWYYVGRGIHIRTLLIVGFGSSLLFQILSEIRHVRVQTFDFVLSVVRFSEILDPLILNRSFLDLTKTSHIITNIPALFELEYGKTLITWLYAPIPRELWPEKPLIQYGPIIGKYIYGLDGSGVPPGIIAELYWNFAIVGLIIGSFVIGWFLRRIYEWFSPVTTENGNHILIYVAVAIPFSFVLISNGLSYAITNSLPDMVIISIILYSIRAETKRVTISNFTALSNAR